MVLEDLARLAQVLDPRLYSKIHGEYPISRRTLFRLAGTTVGAGIAGACSKQSQSPTAPTTPPTGGGPTTPLTITSSTPTQQLPEGTTRAEFGVDTSIDSLCKGDRANVPYDQMTNFISSTPTRVHRTMVDGLSAGDNTYYIAARTLDGSQTTQPRQIVANVKAQSSITGRVIDLHDSRNSIFGKITINGVDREITLGEYSLSGLTVGQKYSGTISANGYIQRNFKDATLTPNGLEVDLGGGRKENPLTVYKESVGFSLAEYIAFCLKRNGASTRIVSPLKFAIFDSQVYTSNGPNFNVSRTSAMRQDSKENLLSAIRQDAPFWTDNQIYTPQNIESQILLQSRGDNLPDISRGGPYWQGYIVVVQSDSITPGFLIARSDNGLQNGGPITAGLMEFKPDTAVQYINWTRDMRETFGIAQIRDEIRDARKPYVAAMFARPVGHTAPDSQR
jgi:hypothetical protein